MYGVPISILTDQGRWRCYKSLKTEEALKKKNIKQIFTSPYNPTGNSKSERINQHLTHLLRINKGCSLEVLTVVIENQTYKIYHHGIEELPDELIEGSEKVTLWIWRELKVKGKTIGGISRRKDYTYKIGQEILMRREEGMLKLLLYLRPHRVLSIDKESQVVIVQPKGDLVSRGDINRIKPYWREFWCE